MGTSPVQDSQAPGQRELPFQFRGNWPRFPLQGEARSAGPGGWRGRGQAGPPRVLTSSRLVSRSREEGEGPTQRAGVRWQGWGRAGPASAAALSFCLSLRPGALPTVDSRKSREGAGKAPQTVLHPPPLRGPGGPDAARPTVPPTPQPPAWLSAATTCWDTTVGPASYSSTYRRSLPLGPQFLQARPG